MAGGRLLDDRRYPMDSSSNRVLYKGDGRFQLEKLAIGTVDKATMSRLYATRQSLDERQAELALMESSDQLEAGSANPVAPLAPMEPNQCIIQAQSYCKGKG